MPTIDTGRSRSLVYDGEISCQFKEVWSWEEDGGCGGDDPLYTLSSWERGYSQVRIEGPWYILEARINSEVTPVPACAEAPDSIPRTRRWRNSVRARIVDPARTTTYSDSGWVHGGWTSFSIPGSVDQTSTGDYEATAPAFERLEYGDLDSALTNSDNFPDYDLGATNDHLEGKAARLYERITSGGNFTATITLGDATATAGPVSTTGNTYEMGLALYYCLCVATAQAFQDSATGFIEANFAGVPLGAAVDHTTAAGTGDAAAGALATSTSSSLIDTYTTTEAALWPGKEIEIPATLRGPSGAYPDSLTMEYVSHRNTLGNEATSTASLGPSATATRTQARYDVEIDVNTSGVSEAIDEYAPTRAWLTPASLTAAGENSSDWRLQFRGKQWTIGELAETNPWNLFDGSSAAGWAGTNASISSSGGVISVAASGGEGSASHNFSPHGKIEAWRYLRLRVRGSAAMSLILELDNDIKPKKWRFDVTTSFADVDIDLCNPRSVEGLKRVNEKYSRWPLDSSRVDDDGTWGVSQLKEILISAIPDGKTLEIDYIRLVRDGDLEWSLLPAFNWWITTTGSQQGSPFAVLNADGRISDWPGVRRTGGSYSWPTITDLMGDIGGLVGLSFTAAGSFPDSFHTNDREALLIYGSGETYDTGWDWGQDKEPIGNITAQMLWDQLEAFPECGDVWGWDTGAYGGPLVMPAAKILRGQAWGLVLDRDGPVASETVTYRTSPGAADRGSDSSEADGYYLTGTPWGLSTGLHRGHAISRQSEELANRNRWRRRVAFLELPPHGGLSGYDVHPDGTHGRAILDQDTGLIEFGTAENTDGATFTAINTGLSALAVAFCWHYVRQTKTGLLLVLDGEDATLYTSEDLGATWTMATTFTSISDPLGAALCVHPDGRVCAYWLDGTTVKGAVMDAALTTLRTASSIRTGVDPGGVSAAAFQRLTVPRTAMLTIESGVPTVTESTDGLAFS
jgi:hypothetical protein